MSKVVVCPDCGSSLTLAVEDKTVVVVHSERSKPEAPEAAAAEPDEDSLFSAVLGGTDEDEDEE